MKIQVKIGVIWNEAKTSDFTKSSQVICVISANIISKRVFIPLQHLYLSPDEWHFNHVYWNHAAISLPIFTCQEMFTFRIHLVYPVDKPNCKRSFSNISGMMIFCILLWLNLNLCWKAIYFSMDLMTCTSCVCGSTIGKILFVYYFYVSLIYFTIIHNTVQPVLSWNYMMVIAGSLESAYSLNWGAREIWGKVEGRPWHFYDK